MVRAGNGGADSCSLVRVARYGSAISGGSAASNTESACPSFIAPPLSSPRTLKTCSAVRCLISWATNSDGRPPRRLPVPSAVRPARPAGSVASFAVRVIALRGRSLIISFARDEGHWDVPETVAASVSCSSVIPITVLKPRRCLDGVPAADVTVLVQADTGPGRQAGCAAGWAAGKTGLAGGVRTAAG